MSGFWNKGTFWDGLLISQIVSAGITSAAARQAYDRERAAEKAKREALRAAALRDDGQLAAATRRRQEAARGGFWRAFLDPFVERH